MGQAESKEARFSALIRDGILCSLPKTPHWPRLLSMALNDRRSFLKMAALAGAFSTNSLFRQAHAAEWEAASGTVSGLDAGQVAQNEDFWGVIQRGYSVSPQIINLNNGGVSPSPIVVQQAVERYNQLSNEGPSYYMW